LYARDAGGASGNQSPGSRRCTILTTGIDTGTLSIMAARRRADARQKVTVELPKQLLERAQRSTGEGVTATLRRGLELVAAREAYARLRALRGKLRLSIDVASLREDRS
jgi:hypothetical protein